MADVFLDVPENVFSTLDNNGNQQVSSDSIEIEDEEWQDYDILTSNNTWCCPECSREFSLSETQCKCGFTRTK